MRIMVSDLPKDNWWGNGINAYDDNWAMEDGVVPNQIEVKRQHQRLIKLLEKYSDIELIPFPDPDKYPEINHDFVFVRDQFVSGNDHSIVVCNFKRPERRAETSYLKSCLDTLGLTYHTLPDGALAEGGEFHYAPNENILFAGINRNNHKGVKEVSKKLGVDKYIVIESRAFHLDTYLSLVFDKHKNTSAVIACTELIENRDEFREFLEKISIELIDIDPIDTLGREGEDGTQAVNGFVLPGVFISNSRFQTRGVEERLQRLGIEHLITPTSEFNLSGGSIHCLTNEL